MDGLELDKNTTESEYDEQKYSNLEGKMKANPESYWSHGLRITISCGTLLH